MNLKLSHSNLKAPLHPAEKQQRIQAMFSGIAPTYDLLNHLLSFNLDRRWRRRAVELSQVQPGQSILDLCCGTGDMALSYKRAEPALDKIMAVDFSSQMLSRARQKEAPISERPKTGRHNPCKIGWLCLNAEKTGLESASFDCISCTFGIRNLSDPQAGLREIYRLLKPGGKVVILEFTLPANPVLAWIYNLYFRVVLPLAGGIIANDRSGAYHYLPESVRGFRAAEYLEKFIRQAGFVNIYREKLTWGIVLAMVGYKA